MYIKSNILFCTLEVVFKIYFAKKHFSGNALWMFQQDGVTTHVLMSLKTGAGTIFLGSGLNKCGPLASQTLTR